jgi:protoporphyrinogen oxidase
VRVGIIGAGLTGLALADRLGSMGHRVTVFERGHQPGGLATWHDFGRFIWDRFYHVILPSDTSLIAFLRSIGLETDLRWAGTRTGYYVDGRLLSLSSGRDFLRFEPLGLWSKIRLAATILYCSRIEDWRSLEEVTVEDFLVRTSGRSTFEKFWKPLLLAKLGENYRRVSAVFIWTYVKRLFSARDSTTQREQLGYVSGGYRKVFQRLMQRIESADGRVMLGVDVSAVVPKEGDRTTYLSHDREHLFDKVIFTGPVNVMRAIVAPELVDAPVANDVEYLGVVCLVLVTRRPVVPYYVVNINDATIPFTGIIGMSSLVAPAETAGLYITYLPKYLLSSDSMLNEPDAGIRESFIAGLRKICPEFAEEDIEVASVHRAAKVQPLQVRGYSRLVQPCRTRSPDFYVVNTAQFVSNTLNNNEVIRTVNAFLEENAADFASLSAPRTGALAVRLAGAT